MTRDLAQYSSGVLSYPVEYSTDHTRQLLEIQYHPGHPLYSSIDPTLQLKRREKLWVPAHHGVSIHDKYTGHFRELEELGKFLPQRNNKH